MANRPNVKVEEQTERASAVPVTSQPPPLVFFPPGPELRDAHREILALRALEQPIPLHLSINDNVQHCGFGAVRRIKAMMVEAGVDDIHRVREFTARAIPG